MQHENRLTQLFVYHVGERVDLIVAPPGSGKTTAVRTWLDSAQDAAAQIWLEDHSIHSLNQVPRSPELPTFVVLDDYEFDATTDSAILRIVDKTPDSIHFVLMTDGTPSQCPLDRVDDGTVRLTTHADIEEALAPSSHVN